jgi:hypothetical protein
MIYPYIPLTYVAEGRDSSRHRLSDKVNCELTLGSISCLLPVRDQSGAVGGLLDSGIQPCAKRSYQCWPFRVLSRSRTVSDVSSLAF